MSKRINPMSEVAEILERAADLIHNAPKLAKGTFTADAAELDDNGRLFRDENLRRSTGNRCYCVEGALVHVSPDPLRSRATAQLLDHLRLRRLTDLFYWNDEPERTKDEVEQALREAAAR